MMPRLPRETFPDTLYILWTAKILQVSSFVRIRHPAKKGNEECVGTVAKLSLGFLNRWQYLLFFFGASYR